LSDAAKVVYKEANDFSDNAVAIYSEEQTKQLAKQLV
jgi:hypothetical protein